MKYWINIWLLRFGLFPLLASLVCLFLFLTGLGAHSVWLFLVITVVYIGAAWLALRFVNHYPEGFVARYGPVCLPLGVTLTVCAVCMVVSKGFYGHGVFLALIIANIAFLPFVFIPTLTGDFEYVLYAPVIYSLSFLLFFALKERNQTLKPPLSLRFIGAGLVWVVVCCVTSISVLWVKSRHILPPDYGFSYGGGYASVDIYRYDPTNSENILAVLEQPSRFVIRDAKKMPVLDGAEAAYPVYSAFANACYEGIAHNAYVVSDETVERDKPVSSKETTSLAGEKITFTNTIYAFERLVQGEIDIFFGAQPSKGQEALASEAGKSLVLTPIGKEAFVFFVSRNNPCDNLRLQEIQDIYTGKIKNWAALTGADEKIYAFQRPAHSGSQTIMEKIMGDTPLAPPLREEYISGMGGVSENVANYRNYPGAIGYSFRFFTTGMADHSDEIKLLRINDVAPTPKNIANESYPFTVMLYAITLEDNPLDTVSPFLAWMQGPEGQELIQKTGYVPLN